MKKKDSKRAAKKSTRWAIQQIERSQLTWWTVFNWQIQLSAENLTVHELHANNKESKPVMPGVESLLIEIAGEKVSQSVLVKPQSMRLI